MIDTERKGDNLHLLHIASLLDFVRVKKRPSLGVQKCALLIKSIVQYEESMTVDVLGVNKAWKGEERAWKVFWIYSLVLGFLFEKLLEVIVKLDNGYLTILYAIVILVWIVWCSASMWKCAFNTNWKYWGYLTRGLMVLIPVSIIVLIAADI